jgi:hypothetical protein
MEIVGRDTKGISDFGEVLMSGSTSLLAHGELCVDTTGIVIDTTST